MDRLSDQLLANTLIFSEVSSSPNCGNDDSTHGYAEIQNFQFITQKPITTDVLLEEINF